MPEEKKSAGPIHRPKTWYVWLFVATGLILVMLALFYAYPKSEIGPQQPIPFSHRVHAGVKQINCRFCHSYTDKSIHAGLPAVEKCFFCHSYIIPTHPELVKEMTYLRTNNPVPWVKIYWVPDFTKFRHQPHIEWGKFDCTVCHGDVQSMDRLRGVDFKMGFCVTCHRENNAQTDCWLACHH